MRALALLAALVWAASLSAQTTPTITPRGGDATLDVAAWNVEFFGTTSPTDQNDTSPNDAFQFVHVEAAVTQSEIDVWGFQEVSDGDDFQRLIEAVEDDGYAGVIGPNVSTPNRPFDQKLAFVYNASLLSDVSASTLFEGQPGASFEFAGRLPLELKATVTVDGQAREVRFITIHAKASRDPDSYERREDGAARLKAYTDGLLAQGVRVVVLGDFNDRLVGSTRGSSFDSPYRPFVDDPAYGAATLSTEEAGLATFCGSDDTCSGGSTIDHILYSSATLGFVPDAQNAQRQRYGELLTELPQYTATTSDHLPVLANLVLTGPVADDAGPEAGPVALLPAAPSPFRTSTRLRFRLDAPADVALDVFDVLGRRVASAAGPYGLGEHAVALDGAGLAPGPYLVRLQAAGQTRSRLITRLD